MTSKEQSTSHESMPPPENTQPLSDDSSTDEETSYYTPLTEEEIRGTVPGSMQTTAMALMCQCAVSNPIVECSHQCLVHKVKRRDSPSFDVGTQTEEQKCTDQSKS